MSTMRKNCESCGDRRFRPFGTVDEKDFGDALDAFEVLEGSRRQTLMPDPFMCQLVVAFRVDPTES